MSVPFKDNFIEISFRNKPYSYFFNAGIYFFELWGGCGGGNEPGFGAYVSGTLKIERRTKLFIFVGQKGINNGTAAYNGGGRGTTYGSSGGGSTDVRLKGGNWDDFESLKSRIIVAGAGGGSASIPDSLSKGGDAGMFEGSEGNFHQSSTYTVTKAQGGKQTEGGNGGIGRTSGNDGEFGKGGLSKGEGGKYAHGGGSGYFGGGGGAINPYVVGSGAGGSSFVSGLDGCKPILKSSTKDNISFSELPFHYSYFIFTNISYKDGETVQWKDDGKVKITLITFIRDRFKTCRKPTTRTNLSLLIIFILTSI